MEKATLWGKYRIIIPIASKLSPNSLSLIKCSAFQSGIIRSGDLKEKKKKHVLNFYNFFFTLLSTYILCMKKALAICFPFKFFFLYVVIFFASPFLCVFPPVGGIESVKFPVRDRKRGICHEAKCLFVYLIFLSKRYVSPIHIFQAIELQARLEISQEVS